MKPVSKKAFRTEPKIKVGIMDGQTEVTGHLDGDFRVDESGPMLSGRFLAKRERGKIVLDGEANAEITRSSSIRLTAGEDSIFRIFGVTIGDHFHWERKEDLSYRGDLILKRREGGTICAINEVSLEDYLKSVISSEMSAEAPIEFLKAHAILSRSWLLATLNRQKRRKTPAGIIQKEGEVIRWYDREDHDLFDVCSDDHCQRYQGITKITSKNAEEAIRQTNGRAMTYGNEICDARYSKACGGITENFETAWDDKAVPYLKSISDASILHHPIGTEEEASMWFLSKPDAYCNTTNAKILNKILPDVDQETKDFFRWKVEYSREELEAILQEKTGFDIGTLIEIVPLCRGPSGRITRLKIVGAKRSIIVGKELEIRRWLSKTHLYSSAFIVRLDADRVILHGAGWGHGVGLCQIGAAVMATQGFSAEEILKHYFSGVEIKKVY